MLKNYLITALRNLGRNKVFTLINVTGLAIGISAALVIFLIVYHEFSFDKFVHDRSRLYRVVLDAKFNGSEGHSSGLPAPLGEAIQNEMTGIEQAVPIFQFQGDAAANVSITRDGSDKPEIFKKRNGVIFTNNQYFYVLPYQWIAGSPQAAMQDPFTVVLTASRAEQYFPSVPASDLIGKKITYNGDLAVTVSGIVKDIDENTSFDAKEFISLPTISKTNLQNRFMMDVWRDWMAYSTLYVKLSKGTVPEEAEAQLNAMYGRHNANANKDDANYIHLRFLPLSEIHFDKRYPAFGQRIASKPALYGLLAIAGFLLLLGCINFINLTTANATQRAKEIGIRKTMGSSRSQLVIRFLGETFLVTAMATVVSVLLAPLLLRMFEDFIPPGIRLGLLDRPYVFLFLLILTITVSLLSGIYPALILSGYKPIPVLKVHAFSDKGETRLKWTRKTLTISQFVAAQFLVIATIILARQISFSLNTDLGFAKNGIITFEIPHDTAAFRAQKLLNSINVIPEVAKASTGFLSPADLGVAFTNVSYARKKDVQANVQIRWGDPEYFDVYKLKLLAGRKPGASDTMKEFVINDTYAKLLGFREPEEAIGQELNFNQKTMPIVGVIQDFHDQSTRASISPMVFGGSKGSIFHVRLKTNPVGENGWQKGISKIQKAFKAIYPEADFEYAFFDETIAKMYENEVHLSKLVRWATGLSILISCLGLLGLVMYTVNMKTKEIGIRKILGASVQNIVSVLLSDFLQPVLIAFFIAAPLAWWVSYKWLENYAYRTPLSWWIFLLSGMIMLLIALATLSIQTIRAAIASPAKALRNE